MDDNTSSTDTRTHPAEKAWPALLWHPLGATEPACCCSARPVFQAVLPASESRLAPIELLLCAHHYRESQSKLHAQRGAIYDRDGRAVALPA